MSVPTLTMEQIATWNLRRLGLLTPFSDAISTVEGLVAVQAQSEYSVRHAISLRTAGKADPLTMLANDGPLIRIWSVRGTLHIVPAHQATVHMWATRDDWFTRWGRFLDKYLTLPRQQVIEQIYPRIAEVLSSEPITHAGIVQAANLSAPYDKLVPHLVKDMCYLGLCTRGRDSKGKATYLAGGGHLENIPTIEARSQLLRDYIKAYGPVTQQDMMYWSGFRSGTVKEVLARLECQLATVRMDGQPGEAYVTKVLLPEMMAFARPDEIAEIRLPAFDVLMLAYKDKRRFLDEEFRKQVFLSAARVMPVVLKNGRVSATWNERTGEVQEFRV